MKFLAIYLEDSLFNECMVAPYKKVLKKLEK